MKIHFKLLKATKTCYRFEHKNGDDLETMYLKKSALQEAGIDPKNGIVITIEEEKENV